MDDYSRLYMGYDLGESQRGVKPSAADGGGDIGGDVMALLKRDIYPGVPVWAAAAVGGAVLIGGLLILSS